MKNNNTWPTKKQSQKIDSTNFLEMKRKFVEELGRGGKIGEGE
jgi:hypothetical protein